LGLWLLCLHQGRPNAADNSKHHPEEPSRLLNWHVCHRAWLGLLDASFGLRVALITLEFCQAACRTYGFQGADLVSGDRREVSPNSETLQSLRAKTIRLITEHQKSSRLSPIPPISQRSEFQAGMPSASRTQFRPDSLARLECPVCGFEHQLGCGSFFEFSAMPMLMVMVTDLFRPRLRPRAQFFVRIPGVLADGSRSQHGLTQQLTRGRASIAERPGNTMVNSSPP